MEIRLLTEDPWDASPDPAVLAEHEMPAVGTLWRRTKDRIRIVGVDAARGELWFEVVGKEERCEGDPMSGWTHMLPAAEFNLACSECGWQELPE